MTKLVHWLDLTDTSSLAVHQSPQTIIIIIIIIIIIKFLH